MTDSIVIGEAIERAGGIKAVATARKLSEEGVRLWRARGKVPADHVLWLAEETRWEYTPHRIAPDLYPHEHDGLPQHLRVNGKTALAPATTP